MTEASLAIARKVVLYIGLLVAALLFAFPHWKISTDIGLGTPAVDRDLGRAFIMPSLVYRSDQFLLIDFKNAAHIHYVRQITEVAIALLLTFGLMRALKLRSQREIEL
jgi:hypothetical protein